MPKTLNINIEHQDGCLWIRLPETIDMDNYQRIEELIGPELAETGGKVVLDFEKTKFLFSSGLGLIIRLKKRVDSLNGVLYLINMSKKLKEGLENVGLDRTFTIYPTEADFKKSEDIG